MLRLSKPSMRNCRRCEFFIDSVPCIIQKSVNFSASFINFSTIDFSVRVYRLWRLPCAPGLVDFQGSRGIVSTLRVCVGGRDLCGGSKNNRGTGSSLGFSRSRCVWGGLKWAKLGSREGSRCTFSGRNVTVGYLFRILRGVHSFSWEGLVCLYGVGRKCA